MKVSKFIILLVFLMALTTSSHAETTVTPEVGFVLNTLLFLMEDFLLCGWLPAIEYKPIFFVQFSNFF